MKILIVLNGAIGDVLRGFSLLKPLKTHFPDCHITWTVEPRSLDMVNLHPLIDKVIVFDRKNGIPAFIKFLKEVRAAGKYDLVLDLQRHFKSGLTSFFSGCNRRIGFHKKNAKEFNWIFNTEQIEYVSEELSKVTHYQYFLKKIGITTNHKIDFGLENLEKPSTFDQKFGQLLAFEYVGVVLGSTWETKDWLEQGYLDLIIKFLAETKLNLVLLGDRSKQKMAQNIAHKLNSPRVIDLCAQTSLLELFYIIADSKFCLGPDSGPGHMAAALNIPYVSIYGPTDPRRVAPYGSEQYSVVSNLACSPCWRRKCPGLDKLCMRLINADAVWQRLDKLI